MSNLQAAVEIFREDGFTSLLRQISHLYPECHLDSLIVNSANARPSGRCVSGHRHHCQSYPMAMKYPRRSSFSDISPRLLRVSIF